MQCPVHWHNASWYQCQWQAGSLYLSGCSPGASLRQCARPRPGREEDSELEFNFIEVTCVRSTTALVALTVEGTY